MLLSLMYYTILYTQEPEGGYTAEVVELPWCVSYGKTAEEAESMIQEAIQAYRESLSKDERNFLSQRKTFTKSLLVHDLH